MNNNSDEDSSYYYDNTNDTTWQKFTYTYNSNNRISISKDVEVISTNGVQNAKTITINYTYDANGNIASEQDNNGNLNIYDYYTDLKSTPLITSPVKAYYGNYIKDVTTYEGNKTAIDLFYYTFDNKNRLISVKEVSSNGTVTLLTSYTYY
jgi:YD repeat-containing protein